MRALPETVTFAVAEDLADAIYRAVQQLPAYSQADLCSPRVQRRLLARLRVSLASQFDALAKGILERLARRPYVAYITGLRVDEGQLLLLAMSNVVGLVVDPYNRAGARLVRTLSPPHDRVVLGVGVLSEALHTDGTDSPEPNDVTCLLCVRPDQNGGGRTVLLDIDTLRASVFPLLSDVCVDVLTSEPVPWKIAAELGGGIVRSPVVTDQRLRWLRDGIADPLPPRVDHALGEFAAGLRAAMQRIEFAMSGGSLLVMDNHRTLHARTGIRDRASSERLVLRTKVCRHVAP